MVSREGIVRDYNHAKRLALKSTAKQRWPDALAYIKLCANIAYNFNFRYCDDDLEQQLSEIGKNVVGSINFKVNKGRCVFYDYFGLDNRGLTQQYLRGLMALNLELLYILEAGDENSAKDIIEELRNYSNAEVVILKGASDIEKISEAAFRVKEFKPEMAFLHMAPWDVVGVALWSNVTCVKRFQVNLTDHAFWLGKCCSDFVLEFRSYGVNISMESRELPCTKLIFQPYYPILNKTEFQGFAFDHTDRTIVFSGAAYYKIYGRNGQFLKLVKRLMEMEKNFLFIFAGNGNDRPIKTFIKENKLDHRFLLIGNRSDINEVFKKIDIFVNTYPVIGALMTQYAVCNGKAIVSYTSPDLVSNYVEGLLDLKGTGGMSRKTEDDFLDEAYKLITDENYRKENAAHYRHSVPTEQEFNTRLKQILEKPESISVHRPAVMKINYDAVVDLYIEMENQHLKSYDGIRMWAVGRGRFFKHYPFAALSVLKRKLLQVWSKKK